MKNNAIDLRRMSINDALVTACKSAIPFNNSGFGGAIMSYSSDAAWDRTIDSLTAGVANQINYEAKIGDRSQSSLVMSAYKFLSNAAPEADLQVKKGKKDKKNAIVEQEHPLVQLWNRPNKFYSGSTMMKAIAFSWVLRSEAFLIKNMDNAGHRPLELWYEPHWTIRPVWPLDGSEFISNYEVNRNGQWIPIALESVIHLRDGLSPYNQRHGLSTIDSVARELYGDIETANYYANMMGGSAVPPFVVSIDKDIDMKPEQVDALTRLITHKTSGNRKGEPLVIRGATIEKLSFNPQEMQLDTARYMPEERFCAVMGIPSVVLELGSGNAHSIYNNVSAAMERGYRSYVVPFWKHIEEELNLHLLEDFEGENSDYFIDHDLSEVQALQEDRDAIAKRMGTLYQAGIAKRGEARSAVGLPPSDPDIEDVDNVFVVVRGQSLVKPGEEILAQGATPEGTNPDGTPIEPPVPVAGAQVTGPQAKPKAQPPQLRAVKSTDLDQTARWLKRMQFDEAAESITGVKADVA